MDIVSAQPFLPVKVSVTILTKLNSDFDGRGDGHITCKQTFKTRLHSSRMRTARALTVSHSMLAGGGMSAPGGRVCCGGGCLLMGVGGCEVPPSPLTESQTPVKT